MKRIKILIFIFLLDKKCVVVLCFVFIEILNKMWGIFVDYNLIKYGLEGFV